MLGVTSYVSVDLSPFPLLWVIPLALYLTSFILVFAKWPVPWVGTPHDLMVFAGVPAIILLFYIILKGGFDPFFATMVSFLGFFLITMVCHGELAKDRPTTRYLTEYFLLMSVGGALGGLFNAMIAPQVFVGVAEYPIAIAVACFLRPTLKKNGWFDELIISAFPSLGNWVRDTGDNMAKSVGRPAPRSYWLLNYALDFLLALFVFALTLWIRNNARNNWGWYLGQQGNGLITVLKFLGFSDNGAAEFWPKAINLGIYGPGMIFCMMFGFGRSFRFGLAMSA